MSIGKFFLDALSATAQTAVQAQAHGTAVPRPGQRRGGVPCTPCAASALRAKSMQQFMPQGYRSPPAPRRAR